MLGNPKYCSFYDGYLFILTIFIVKFQRNYSYMLEKIFVLVLYIEDISLVDARFLLLLKINLENFTYIS